MHKQPKIIKCELCDKPATDAITATGGNTSYWCTKHFNQTIKQLEA